MFEERAQAAGLADGGLQPPKAESPPGFEADRLTGEPSRESVVLLLSIDQLCPDEAA